MRNRPLSRLIVMLTLSLIGLTATAGERVPGHAFGARAGDEVQLQDADHEERGNYHGRDRYRDDDRYQTRHRDLPLVSVGAFRTRERDVRETTVGLPDGTEHLQLVGTRRALVVHRAVVRFDDGRSQRLRRLEGFLANGDVINSRLRDCTGGVLYLETSPADRGKRGYAEILVGITPPRRRGW